MSSVVLSNATALACARSRPTNTGVENVRCAFPDGVWEACGYGNERERRKLYRLGHPWFVVDRVKAAAKILAALVR
jgi:hypothetical protein